jgi:serine/threonine protein kinase
VRFRRDYGPDRNSSRSALDAEFRPGVPGRDDREDHLKSWRQKPDQSPEAGEPSSGLGEFTIGKYRILERIGAGGFGKVFKAWDPVIKRPVAIKTCNAGGDVRARFLQEAELSGRLHHHNITSVYEFGMEGETPYIVQEFLSGEDLSAVIARRDAMSVLEKVKILVGVAFGLEYAHGQGVIHRDVKPANVRLLEDRTVKIMDFGIAKAMGASNDLTGTGVALGSTAHMSPEQICGDSVDLRTDIFSFGVLAYELLSYHKPFRNDSVFRLLEAIVKEEPDPIEDFAPELSPSLVAVVRKAMRKNPEDRFSSMTDLRNALVAVYQYDASSPFPRRRPAPLPDSEARRLDALKRYDLLDTPPEAEFDDLVRLAARFCATPMALISLVEADRQWFKAKLGIDIDESPRDVSFCAHAILDGDVMVVPDATQDERFADNPYVKGDPRIRFYAGAPLVSPDGLAVGTLCVLDRKPRELSEDQRDALRVLARQVVAQMELRRRRRAEAESSGERLLLEVAGIKGPTPGHGPAGGADE